MSCVTLTFEVWIQFKATARRLNEDNIWTQLDGNPSMHTYSTDKECYRRKDGQTDGQSAFL